MVSNRKIIAIPPGETIKEQLIEHNMNVEEFSEKMDMSIDQINCLIKGDLVLNAEIAEQLERVLGVPAYFWKNLENIYRNKLSRINEEVEN